MSNFFPTLGDVSASKYLKKEDCGEDGILARIGGFTQEEFENDGKTEIKVIMHFQGDTKPMVLNNVNFGLISGMYGPNTKEWVGKQITLYNDPDVMFGNEKKGGIRVYVPKKVPKAAAGIDERNPPPEFEKPPF